MFFHLAKNLKDIELLGKIHVGGLLGKIRSTESLARSLHHEIDSKLTKELESLGDRFGTMLQTRASAIETAMSRTRLESFMMQEALMGHIELNVGSPVVEVSRALLNAAAVGTFTTTVVGALLHPATKKQHLWVRSENLRMSGNDTIADQTVPAFSITDPVEVQDGNCRSILTWGTGTGAYAAGVAATGTITCVAGADLVDGETVTIKDATGFQKVFEFDDDGTVVGLNTKVSFTDADDADTVAINLAAAIMASGLAVTVVVTDEDLALTQNYVGDIGNHAITDTVTDSDFTVVGFATGAADKIVVTLAVESAPSAGDDKLPFGNFEVAPVTQTFVVR